MTMDSKYTNYMNEKAHSAILDRKELQRIIKEFRSSGEAVSDYLVDFNCKSKDTTSKVAFLKNQFKQKGILSTDQPRDMDRWFDENRPIEKVNGIKLCYAFGLDIDQSNELIRRVCYERGLYCHDRKEAVHYFCIKNNLPFQVSKEIMNSLHDFDELTLIEEPLNTERLKDDIDSITNKEEFIKYINDNAASYQKKNNTAYDLVKRIWKKIEKKNGLLDKEKNYLYYDSVEGVFGLPETTKKSTSSILFTILFPENFDVKSKAIDRSLKPLINNSCFHKVANDEFPDRGSIGIILRNGKVSDEKLRKTIILLMFYYLCLKYKISEADFSIREQQSTIGKLNKSLHDSGFAKLYPGNPYDWIFLYSLLSYEKDDTEAWEYIDPLTKLREYMALACGDDK